MLDNMNRVYVVSAYQYLGIIEVPKQKKSRKKTLLDLFYESTFPALFSVRESLIYKKIVQIQVVVSSSMSFP